MNRPKIVVVGSSNTDMVINTPRLPVRGETILGGEFMLAAGGKGANQAVAAARLGADVTFVGRLGVDMFGDEALKNLRAEGIHTDLIARDDTAPSGVALILVEEGGENVIAVAPGANHRLTPADVEAAKDRIQGADVLLAQLEIPLDAVECAVNIAAQAGTRVILNPAPAQPLQRSLLRQVSVLTPNRQESQLLAESEGDEDPSFEILANRLRSMGCHSVVITLGATGAFVRSEEESGLVASSKVQAIDTTASGDAFNGALSFSLASGQSLMDSVAFANRTGAFAATRKGAQPSLPTLAELK